MGLFKNKDDVAVEPIVVAPDVVETQVQAHEAEELDSVEQSNKDNNEAITGDGPSDGLFVENPERQEGETQQEYNERVPVAVQPVLEGPTLSYLGKPL